MNEQAKAALADLNKLLTEYVDAYYGRTNKNEWPSQKFATLKAAFELYYNHKIIQISSEDLVKLKICLYGIEEHPYNTFVQDGAIHDMKNIFAKLSDEYAAKPRSVAHGVINKNLYGSGREYK